MALGAIQALEAAGRQKEVLVIGIDGEEIAFKAIKDEKSAATFIYPRMWLLKDIELAYKIAKGESVPGAHSSSPPKKWIVPTSISSWGKDSKKEAVELWGGTGHYRGRGVIAEDKLVERLNEENMEKRAKNFVPDRCHPCLLEGQFTADLEIDEIAYSANICAI